MAQNQPHKNDNIVIFPPDTPPKVKIRKSIFFAIFCLITLVQACYWLFANSAEPILLGMPFGMFFITMLIAVEFVVLLMLYFIEAKEMEE